MRVQCLREASPEFCRGGRGEGGGDIELISKGGALSRTVLGVQDLREEGKRRGSREVFEREKKESAGRRKERT